MHGRSLRHNQIFSDGWFTKFYYPWCSAGALPAPELRYKNKKNKDEKASGINPDPPTENETLLEEIVEAMESTTLRVGNANSKKDDQKRKEALACRDKAMTTWAKAGARKCHREEDCKEKRKKKKS